MLQTRKKRKKLFVCMLINELRGGASIGSKKTAALVRILFEDCAASDVLMRPTIPGGPSLHRPLFILTII